MAYKERHEATRRILQDQIDKHTKIEQEGKTAIQIKKDQKDTLQRNLAQLEADHKSNMEQFQNLSKVNMSRQQHEEMALQGKIELLKARIRTRQQQLDRAAERRENAAETIDPMCFGCGKNKKNIINLPCGHVSL